MLRAYARVSSDEQADFYNALKNQISRLDRSNYEKLYQDTESGTSNSRLGFKTLLSDLERGDTVVVTKFDRLTRDASTALRLLEDFYKKGIKLHILEMGGLVDLSNPYSWQQLAHQGVDNSFYVKLLSVNVRRGYEELRRQKKANPVVPMGYVRVNERYSLDPQNSFAIRRFFDLFLEIKSLNKTKRKLEEEGVVIWISSLRNILLNPVYYGHTPRWNNWRGKAEGRVSEIDYNTHPDQAIATEAERVEILRILGENKKYWGRNVAVKTYPLGGGLIRCGYCDSSMVICCKKSLQCRQYREFLGSNGSCNFSYQIRTDKVEEIVITELAKASERIISEMESSLENSETIDPKILDLRSQLKGLVGDHPAIVAARTQIEREIYNLSEKSGLEQSHKSENQNLLIQAGSDREFWETLPDESKRVIYRELIKEVTVKLHPEEVYRKPNKYHPMRFDATVVLNV